jgi:hypothetical protein
VQRAASLVRLRPHCAFDPSRSVITHTQRHHEGASVNRRLRRVALTMKMILPLG